MERDEEPVLRAVSVPVFDTGVGRAMGYASDEEFVAAAVRRREEALEQLPPEVRVQVELAERAEDLVFLVGLALEAAIAQAREERASER